MNVKILWVPYSTIIEYPKVAAILDKELPQDYILGKPKYGLHRVEVALPTEEAYVPHVVARALEKAWKRVAQQLEDEYKKEGKK